MYIIDKENEGLFDQKRRYFLHLFEKMKYKKNLQEVIRRNEKLWNRDFQSKILAKIDIDGFQTFEMWDKALSPGYCPDYKKMFQIFLENFRKREFLLDDATPTARPNIGDAAFGGYAGADIIFGQGGGYAKPFLKDLRDVEHLRYDATNNWIKLLIDATKYFAKNSKGLCATSIIETMDSLNFAENVFGSNIFLEIYDNPKGLLKLFDFAFEFNIRLIEEQRKYIKKFNNGYFDLHEEWLPNDCIWLSIDSWGHCSVENFKELGKHHLQKMINYFGCGWLHMHNSHLHLLREAMTVKDLVGIGILDDPKQERCFPKLIKIQKITRGVPLQINCGKEEFLQALKEKSLPRNVMYWIDSGVGSVEEGNKIMEMVYEY
jgi:hypothetical protein